VRGIHQHRNEWIANALVAELNADELETVRQALPLLQRIAQH
jgi:hypothetical protein